MANHSLLPNAEHIAAANEEIVTLLQRSDEPDLLAALALRVRETAAGSVEVTRMSVIELDQLPRDASTIALGRRILARWSHAMHDFLCKSDGDDDDLRSQLMGVITGGSGGAAALMAGTLVAAFGASPAVAAIVAALLMKTIVVPAKDEICAYWAASLADPTSVS
jgi:hypothetical protein